MGGRFDETWRASALEGDPRAVDLLVEQALPALYRFCLYRVGRDEDLCEEVTHATLVRAIEDLERYDPRRTEGRILPWLTGLCRNELKRALAGSSALSLDLLWGRMDRDLLSAYARIDRAALDEEALRREEARDLVNRTMAELPERYREALTAKYVERRTTRDLAASLSISAHAVESLLARARASFRATFLSLVETFSHLESIPEAP